MSLAFSQVPPPLVSGSLASFPMSSDLCSEVKVYLSTCAIPTVSTWKLMVEYDPSVNLGLYYIKMKLWLPQAPPPWLQGVWSSFQRVRSFRVDLICAHCVFPTIAYCSSRFNECSSITMRATAILIADSESASKTTWDPYVICLPMSILSELQVCQSDMA